ncbi:MAG: hypothetical protein C1943_11375 [Halochromatium sp.]|nr:hypothetical protein [Halochromatium sp.]
MLLMRPYLPPIFLLVTFCLTSVWLPEFEISSANAVESESARVASPEQRLQKRVEQRWEALTERNFEAAYAFETPGYRKTASLSQFQAQFGSAVNWLGATVRSVEIADSGDRAEVQVNLRYQGRSPLGGLYTSERAITERWIISKDEWWYVRD